MRWLRDLEHSLEEIGWKGVQTEDIRRLSLGDIWQMPRDNAWKMVKGDSEAEVHERSKLCGKGSVGI